MSVALIDSTFAAGSTSISIAYASAATGDYIVVAIASKYEGPASVTGPAWTLLHQSVAGSGSAGADAGNAYLSVYGRVYTSGDPTPVWTITTGNSASARNYTLRRTGGDGWGTSVASGSRTTPSTTWSVTMGADNSPPVKAGSSYVIGIAAWNGDLASPSSPVFTHTGVDGTVGTQYTQQTTVGDDSSLVSWGRAIYSGQSTAAPTFQVTASTTSGDHPTGPAILLNVYETTTFSTAIQYLGARLRSSSSSGGTTWAPTFAEPTSITVGNTLLARIACDNAVAGGGKPTLSLSDSAGNVWTLIGSDHSTAGSTNNGVCAYLYSARVTNAYTAGATLTVDFNGTTVTNKACVVDEWYRLDPTVAVSVTDTNNATAVTIDITPTATGQLIYAAVASEGDGDDHTHDSDTTAGFWSTPVRQSTTTGTGVTIDGGYKVVTGTSAQQLSVESTSRRWAAVTAVFGPSTGVTIPSSDLIEIEFTAGVWTDLTASVDATVGWTTRRGRSSKSDRLQPGALDIAFNNLPDTAGIYHLMPDNPLSTYYPNVVEGKRIRVKTTVNSVTYTRFLGWVESWTPYDVGADQFVHVQAVDILGQMARRILLSDYSEKTFQFSSADPCEVWPLDDSPDATVFRNIGDGAGTPMRVVPHRSGGGTVSFGTPDGLLVDGEVTFRQDAGRVGPVMRADLSPTDVFSEFGFWLKLDPEVTPGSVADVAVGYDTAGVALWRVSMMPVGSIIEIRLRKGDGTVVGTTSLTGGIGDSQWRFVLISSYDSGGEILQMFANDEGFSTFEDVSGTRTIIIGGTADNLASPGKQSASACSISGPYVMYSAVRTQHPNPVEYARIDPVPNVDRANDLYTYFSDAINISGASINDGDDGRNVRRELTTGQNVLDVWDKLAFSTGSTLRANSNGTIYYTMADDARETTASLTINLDEDLDGTTSPVWRRAAEINPTRVVATSPQGTGTSVNAAAELYGARREQQIETACATADDAASIAASIVYGWPRMGVSQLTLHLSTSSNNRYPSAFLVDVGSRVTITGIDSGMYGITTLDAFILGYTEQRTANGYWITYDLQPADAPPEAIVDTDRARVGATDITVSTCTSSATSLTLTTNSGEPLTVSAGDYPLDLDVNGERVTVPAAPASSVSPQTVTSVTRGVAPTVARAHSTGEAVDIWLSATIAV